MLRIVLRSVNIRATPRIQNSCLLSQKVLVSPTTGNPTANLSTPSQANSINRGTLANPQALASQVAPNYSLRRSKIRNLRPTPTPLNQPSNHSSTQAWTRSSEVAQLGGVASEVNLMKCPPANLVTVKVRVGPLLESDARHTTKS